jgi:hypothetical protein
LFSFAKRIFNFGKEMFMKNTNKNKTNSHGLLAIALVVVAVIGLSMAACSNDITGDGDQVQTEPTQTEPTQTEPVQTEQGPNLFLGEWEGNIISSTYEGYGEIPVDFTITEEGWFLEVMGQTGEGTYTLNGNVMTILYYDEPMGTCTLNAAGEIEIEIVDESFGNVVGTLRRKTTEPPVVSVVAVTVDFKNAEDAEIIMEDFILDEDGELAVTVEETFAVYAWYINGVLADDALLSNNGKTITLNGGGDYLNFGNNRLSVKVTANDGVIYSKTVIFTVE